MHASDLSSEQSCNSFLQTLVTKKKKHCSSVAYDKKSNKPAFGPDHISGIEYFTNMCEALGLIPITAETNKQTKTFKN